jgi:hypothetical protein
MTFDRTEALLRRTFLFRRTLRPRDPAQKLYQAAVDASWECFPNVTREKVSVALDTLFPGSGSRVFAEWYTGVLNIPEGELVDYFHGGFLSTYERNRLFDIRSGNAVREHVRKNDGPSTDPDQDEKLRV